MYPFLNKLSRPATNPILASIKNMDSNHRPGNPLGNGIQVSPPLMVFNIMPNSPQAYPVFISVKKTEFSCMVVPLG